MARNTAGKVEAGKAPSRPCDNPPAEEIESRKPKDADTNVEKSCPGAALGGRTEDMGFLNKLGMGLARRPRARRRPIAGERSTQQWEPARWGGRGKSSSGTAGTTRVPMG